MQFMSFIQKHTLPPQSLARLRWHRLWPTFCCQWIYHDLPTNAENLKVKNLNISTSNETPILQVTGWLRLTSQDQKQQNVHEHPISTGRCYENIFKLNQKQQRTGVEKGEGTLYYCTFGLVLWTKWGRKQMNRKPMVGYLALYVNFKPFLAWAKDFEELPILHCSNLRLQESIKSTAFWRTWSWVYCIWSFTKAINALLHNCQWLLHAKARCLPTFSCFSLIFQNLLVQLSGGRFPHPPTLVM